MMRAIVAELSKSPDLPGIGSEIAAVLAEEARRREEFRNTVTENDKAEFINGEAVYHSAARRRHNDATLSLAALLKYYCNFPGRGLDQVEKAMIGLTRNDYEPDVCYFLEEKAQHIDADEMIYPAPDFIAEVLSPSTAKNDRGVKFEDYAAHGVGEYWIIDPEAQVVEQYILEGDRYALRAKQADGHLTSAVIPGFRIPVRAIFDDAENAGTAKRLLTE